MNDENVSVFKKAEKKKSWLKIALTGPSGSGKTMSSLRLAAGMGKKIAVIDTENGSASLYSDRFEFDVVELRPPYLPKKYLDAIRVAESADYDVLVIDTISHVWAGEGGLLEKKEALDRAGKGNSYTNWASITKEHEQFKAALLNAQLHLVCTMRSKQDYVLQTNDKGKQIPVKVGMAPVQREGIEYEFTTVFDVAMSHMAEVSKDRTKLFDGQLFQITEETGELFTKWLEAGAGELIKAKQEVPVIPKAEAFSTNEKGNFIISEAQRKRLFAISKEANWSHDDVKNLIGSYGYESTTDIEFRHYDMLINRIQKNPHEVMGVPQ